MSERRIEGRYLCADLVKVDWLFGEDEFRTDEAVLEDISAVGSCVQVENPIPLGASIMLSIHEERFIGHVCYCVFRDYGYFIGIRFSADTVWNEDKVLPQHLTNLTQLACEVDAG